MSHHPPVVTALRYVQPLREGGSLPAVVDTDDGAYVVKFRGAGQGPKALVAELISAGVARALDLPVPPLALVQIDPQFGISEPDPEIQDLLRASHGTNVGLRYLDGAFNFAPSAAGDLVDPRTAARIVWMDALLTNPDRTHRNTNILVWERQPWLIDHGAALYAHHDWSSVDDARTRTPFPLIRDHVLLTIAEDVTAIDGECASRLNEDVLNDIMSAIPADLLLGAPGQAEFESADAARARYVAYLATRLGEPRAFVQEASSARRRVEAEPPLRLKARR
ncbi:MAG TPA: HipA family kinase [Longimicrobiales bacterium]|nr:HipA family kinase [Longimicrobiales bacterium]